MTVTVTVTCAALCHQILPMSARKKLFDEMRFDEPVPFNQGDAGPSGGIQVRPRSPERMCACTHLLLVKIDTRWYCMHGDL